MERRRETDSQDSARRGTYTINQRLRATFLCCYNVCRNRYAIALMLLLLLGLVGLIVIWFVALKNHNEPVPLTSTNSTKSKLQGLRGTELLNSTYRPLERRDFGTEAFTTHNLVQSTNHSSTEKSTFLFPTNGRFSIKNFSLNEETIEEGSQRLSQNTTIPLEENSQRIPFSILDGQYR